MWSAVATGIGLACGLAAYFMFAWPALAHGASPVLLLLGVPALYGLVLALFVAWYFALSWIYRARRPPQARIGLPATLRLVWLEYWTLVGAPLRMLFYRWLLPRPKPAAVAVPVLLVHGLLCNAGVWWRAVRFLRAAGIRGIYVLSYGPPLASIERFAVQLHHCVERIRADTGAQQVVLVTHSMGGLVALAYLRRYGRAHVRKLVAIGAPFAGSAHARCFPGLSLAQLRPGNAWLRALDPRMPGGLPVVSLWSWHDSMVAPQTSSILRGAENVALAGIGHNALLRDPQVLTRVLAECRAEMVIDSTGEAWHVDAPAGAARRRHAHTDVEVRRRSSSGPE